MIYMTGRRDRCDLSGHPYLCTPLLTVIPTNSKSNIAGAPLGAPPAGTAALDPARVLTASWAVRALRVDD